ncbi:hypothetical protein HY008_03425 [Candidatus Woesebacteria bacterium]|nr:hypothetical protein [Candidatus Woesebacteria bacterium]
MVPIFSGVFSELEIYPGFIVAETLGFARGVEIQINLEGGDLQKTKRRMEAILATEGKEWIHNRPAWWPYESQASDMTRSDDSSISIGAIRLSGLTADRQRPDFWGKARSDPRTDLIDFEYEEVGDSAPRRVWEEYQDEVEQALRYTAVIAEMLKAQ